MSTKHTPGPWAFAPDVRDYGNGDEVVGWNVYSDCGVREIIGCEGILPDEDGRANARLIAAAPELLAELRIVYDRSYNPFEPDNQSEQYKRVGALIAKATGATT